MEIWKDIEGFEGKYQVSSWGRVRNAITECIIKPYRNHKGYLKIGLTKGDKCVKFRLHRLVAKAFIPNPDNLPQVNHKDGNKANNSFTNLEWVTNIDNAQHAMLMKHGIIKL